MRQYSTYLHPLRSEQKSSNDSEFYIDTGNVTDEISDLLTKEVDNNKQDSDNLILN